MLSRKAYEAHPGVFSLTGGIAELLTPAISECPRLKKIMRQANHCEQKSLRLRQAATRAEWVTGYCMPKTVMCTVAQKIKPVGHDIL